MARGKRDIFVEFLRRSTERSPRTNAPIDSWAVVGGEWAEVRDVLPSRADRLTDQIDIARRPCRIRCDWRDDVTPDMRVRIGARVLQIVAGPADLGRRDAMEIMAEEVSGQGAAA